MAPFLRKLQARSLPGQPPLITFRHTCSHSSLSRSLDELQRDCVHQSPRWKEENSHLGGIQSCSRGSSHALSRWVGQVCGWLGSSSPSSSSMLPQRWSSCLFARSMAGKSRDDRKKRDLARREFQLLRRKAKLMRATLSPEERLLWRLRKSNRKKAVLLQRLKKYELEDDPEPVHDPELITPEQLQALKKIGYKNRNYVPVGRRGVYGGVVQNMHMHWKFHETVQVDCHIFKREDIRSIARQLAVLSGGIVIDIHQSTTIIMYRGRNYKQPKTEMIPPNTLTKRKALFKSKFLQALEGLETNIREIEAELQVVRRKQKEGVAKGTENDSSKPPQILGNELVNNSSLGDFSDISSDEGPDDGIFSWDSDSLDEDELSDDDEFNHKKADEVNLDEKKTSKSTSWTTGDSARSGGKRNALTAKELITAEQELFKSSPKRHANNALKSGLVSSQNDNLENKNSGGLDDNLKTDDDDNGEKGDGITDGDLQGLDTSQVDSIKLFQHAPEVKEASFTDDDHEGDSETEFSFSNSKKATNKSVVASRGKGHEQIKNKKIAKFVEDFMTDEEEFGSDFDKLEDFSESKVGSSAGVKCAPRNRENDTK
eukprot:c14427_g1_i1 orf=651-2447(-)